MSERKKGATGVTLEFRLTDSTTGAAKSGIDVTTLKLQYKRPGEAASTATSLTLKATFATAWAAYAAKEADATNSKGVYDVDVPDAAFAGTPDEVTISISGTGVETSTRLVDLMGVDAHNAAEGVMQRTGTAQAGGASTITLDAGASSSDGSYVGHTIAVVSGTGSVTARQVVSYVGSTKVATVNRAWNTNPDSTSVYAIYRLISPVIDASNFVYQSVGTGTGQVNASGGKVPATIAAGDIATDALTAAAVKADAVTKIQAGLSTYAGGAVASVTAAVTLPTVAPSGYGPGGTVGFAILAGSTSTVVALSVPADTVVSNWVGRKLFYVRTESSATISIASLSGTTATVTIGTGWPTPTTTDPKDLGVVTP